VGGEQVIARGSQSELDHLQDVDLVVHDQNRASWLCHHCTRAPLYSRTPKQHDATSIQEWKTEPSRSILLHASVPYLLTYRGSGVQHKDILANMLSPDAERYGPAGHRGVRASPGDADRGTQAVDHRPSQRAGPLAAQRQQLVDPPRVGDQ